MNRMLGIMTLYLTGGVLSEALAEYVVSNRYLPIQRQLAVNPLSARVEDIEGYCLLEFTVNEAGNVENADILECSPIGYYEESSLAAVLNFKYIPRIKSGKAVKTYSIRDCFWFSSSMSERYSSANYENCSNLLKNYPSKTHIK